MSVVDDRLSVGSVIFEYVTTTKPPKDKYYVVVGISDDKIALGTVYINSEINPNLFTNTNLKKLHISLSATDNPFLKRDSFIDCSSINERLIADVQSCITSGDTKYGYVSHLPTDTMQTVNTTLDDAFTISPITKKKYGIRK
jgi:hypothetical protein